MRPPEAIEPDVSRTSRTRSYRRGSEQAPSRLRRQCREEGAEHTFGPAIPPAYLVQGCQEGSGETSEVAWTATAIPHQSRKRGS